MPRYSTSAILLRKIDFGDYDVIVTFFAIDRGKISAIAKFAKKSTRRFLGVLEPFSELNIVCEKSRRGRLPILQEAVLIRPFSKIRQDIQKTAYASYWAEMIYVWMEEGEQQPDVYQLYLYVLEALDGGHQSAAALSILFQLRFLSLSGYAPNFMECIKCRKKVEEIRENRVRFDLKKGGLICGRCASGNSDQTSLSDQIGLSNQISLQKGSIKQLLWIEKGALKKIVRIRFTEQAIQESLPLLEAFTPYHLGKKPRSLSFLQQIRK